MSRSNRFSRRRFLKRTTALATGLATVPYLVPSGVLAAPGKPGANDRIGIGYIGCGRRANQRMGLPAEGQIVAACDVDRSRAQAVAEKKNCRAYTDYRKMLEADDLDAVFVTTPDHWHVRPAIHACQAGKDVYLEKPLSLTVREGRVLVDAVRKYGRVLQTGSQRRSMKYHRLGCELVRNGVAGKIHTVLIMNYPSPWECAFPGQPVPDGLDWDVWCGMTEPVPYHADIFIQRSNPGWLSFRPWSGGEMTGTGAHGFDQIQWALDTDHTGPVEIWCEGGKLEAPVYTQPESGARGNLLTSRDRRVRFRYAGGIEVRLEEGESAAGAAFVGDLGKIRIGNNTLDSNPPELAKEPPSDMKIRVPVSDDHIQNWFDSIRSREKPIADVEIGHRSAILCHLGNIARWVGRPLSWDPEQEIFPGDDEANAYLDRPRRKGYELPELV
jgi:predicted dehydrogenase